MTISDIEGELDVRAAEVRVSEAELTVDFEDGRTLSVPLAWYPRLEHAKPKERRNFEIGAFGIHWPELDEDISYRGLLLGRRSQESSESLAFWLDARRKGKTVTLEDFVKAKRRSKAGKKEASR
jgi:hypothetical protein